eukprot:EG_transcript_13139
MKDFDPKAKPKIKLSFTADEVWKQILKEENASQDCEGTNVLTFGRGKTIYPSLPCWIRPPDCWCSRSLSSRSMVVSLGRHQRPQRWAAQRGVHKLKPLSSPTSVHRLARVRVEAERNEQTGADKC